MSRHWEKKSDRDKPSRKKPAVKKPAKKAKAAPKKRRAAPAKKTASRSKASPGKKTARKSPAKRTPKKNAAAGKRTPKKSPAKKKTSRSAQGKTQSGNSSVVVSIKAFLTGKWPRRILWGAGILVAVFFLVTVSWVAIYGVVNPPITVLMLARNMAEDIPIEKRWRDYEEISPQLKLAVLCAEDQRFPDHHGFDLKEMRNAIETRLEGGSMRGASTITQQVVKNVFLWPDRTFLRKGLEAYFTVLVELFWSKERILEVYLNVAEMGTGIYGAESAAQGYFHKSASDLSREEAALLAAILPNPRVMSPVQPDEKVRRKQQWILVQMHNLGGTAFLKKLAPAE